MCATTSIDYSFPVAAPPPPGYPQQRVPDAFAPRPISDDFATRRRALLDHILRNPAPENLKAPYYELARLAAGGSPHLGVFEAAFDYIDLRKDCADFVLHAILRLLHQFSDSPALSEELLQRARCTVLGFKYWPDEPGVDSMCTWTENHQILFAAGAYLAGQLYPDEVFSNSGQIGRQKMEVHRPRIVRWLDLRFRTGFSEWLSHYYYDEDLAALVSLVDFCNDDEIRQRSAMVLDLLLYDLALNNFRGTFGCTHGRSYEAGKKRAADEPTTDTAKLFFGMGRFSLHENLSAVCLALSERYRLPQVIYDIAVDQDRAELISRQQMGIRLDEAGHWGLGFDDFEDGMVYLSLEAYAHHRTINLVMRMFDAYGWWDNAFFAPLSARRGLIQRARKLGLMPFITRLFDRDINRNTRECVNIHTYRTPDYMLSSAQDYRKGYGGDQQHVWQATFGPDAVCFTTHPAPRDNPSPSYWTGSGSLPRVAQVQNVAIAVYNIDTRPGLYLTNRLLFSHAWLPRDAFDEVVEQDGWVFARRGDGYLALRSQHPYRWQTEPGEDHGREMIVPGKRNVWICELGRYAVDGSFDDFTLRIAAAQLGFGRLSVSYHSPSQGHLEFGWRGPLCENGNVVPLDDYARYDGPYCQASFPPEDITIYHGDHSLHLNWPKAAREASALV